MRGLGELDELYREIILEHYRSPHHSEPIDDPDADVRLENPFCGDEINVQLKQQDGRFTGVGVYGQGCSISQASGSLMSDLVEGRDTGEVRELERIFRSIMMGEEVAEAEKDRLDDLLALEGVRKYPIRIKCALLAWSALSDALNELESDGGGGQGSQ